MEGGRSKPQTAPNSPPDSRIALLKQPPPHLHHERALVDGGEEVALQKLAQPHHRARPRGAVAAEGAVEVEGLHGGGVWRGRGLFAGGEGRQGAGGGVRVEGLRGSGGGLVFCWRGGELGGWG